MRLKNMGVESGCADLRCSNTVDLELLRGQVGRASYATRFLGMRCCALGLNPQNRQWTSIDGKGWGMCCACPQCECLRGRWLGRVEAAGRWNGKTCNSGWASVDPVRQPGLGLRGPSGSSWRSKFSYTGIPVNVLVYITISCSILGSWCWKVASETRGCALRNWTVACLHLQINIYIFIQKFHLLVFLGLRYLRGRRKHPRISRINLQRFRTGSVGSLHWC